MNRLRIGVRLESMGLPLRQALAEAARLGVAGVQLDAVRDLGPTKLSQTGRRELRHLLKSHNLELTAVGCPLRFGLDEADDQGQRIEHVRAVMDLSFDLGPRLVIIQAGQLPDLPAQTEAAPSDAPAIQGVSAGGLLIPDASLVGLILGTRPDDRVGRLRETLDVLARHGDRTGTILALETGLEDGATMRSWLDRFDSAGLAANYDPANLLMNRFDPVEAARALHGKIAHAHAKDARSAGASRAVQEVGLASGDLDWLELIGVFEEIEYRGWLVVERESGDGLADVRTGVAFLRRLLGE